MIELTRCGAQENDRYLPAVMTQGGTSTYETMIDSSTPQTRPRQMVSRSPEVMQSGIPAGTERMAPGLGPLPSGPEGMSASEQILHSSWKSLMARNVGRSVIVSFLIGTQNTIVTHGILYEVGNDYIALYQPDEESYISADLYSIRFVEFLPEVTQTNSRQQRQ